MTTCTDLLGDDVLEEIFSWLSPDSLIEFKCVSKSWYALIRSLIKNPTFVNKHFHNVNNLLSSTCLVFCCLPLIVHKRDWESVRCEVLFPTLTIFHGDNGSDRINCVTEVIDLPILPSKFNVNIKHSFRSHCNGIICLTFDQSVILCNPTIKECRILPKPCLTFSIGFVTVGVGFGYDSRANDYKVVKFGFHEMSCPNTLATPKFSKAEVYSMRTDCWREIGIDTKLNRFYHHNEVFCKGVFYWSTWPHIISFDLCDEVFHSLPLPNDVIVNYADKIKLTLWNDSVALLVYPRVSKFVTKSMQVWVMDNCSGGNNSWTKRLTIRPLVDIETPLTFWKNDELLMKTTNKGELISYNIDSQMFRRLISFQGTVKTPLIWDYSYVNSLISVSFIKS